jgi:hypothetical protein
MNSLPPSSDDARAEQPQLVRQYVLREHLIILLDVLGQKQQLLRVCAWPTTESQLAETREVLTRTAGFVKELRKAFDTAFEAFAQRSPLYARLTPDQQAIYRRVRRPTITWTPFSDLVLIAVPTDEDNDYLTAMLNMLGALVATCFTQVVALAEAHAMRGGAEAGWVVHMGGKDLYGPAIAQAHVLESMVADVPRVAVGDGLSHFLERVKTQPAASRMADAARMAAQECAGLLINDPNGVRYLDFLSPLLLPIAHYDPNGLSFIRNNVRRAQSFVVGEVARLENGDPRILDKYKWLQGYFDSKASAWFS